MGGETMHYDEVVEFVLKEKRVLKNQYLDVLLDSVLLNIAMDICHPLKRGIVCVAYHTILWAETSKSGEGPRFISDTPARP
jgi:hypothetical protein